MVRPDVRLSVQSGLHVGPVVARRLHEGPRRYDIVGAPATRGGAIWRRLPIRQTCWSARRRSVWSGHTCTRRLLAGGARLAGRPGDAVPRAWGDGDCDAAGSVEPNRTDALRRPSARAVDARIAGRRRAASGRGSVDRGGRRGGRRKEPAAVRAAGASRGATGVRVLQARCRAYGDGVPYGVFVQILCAALDLRPPLADADAVAARIRAVDAVARAVPAALPASAVGEQRRVRASPTSRRVNISRRRCSTRWRRSSASLTRRAPLVMLIEDWQWADTGSRAAFVRVAELVGSSAARADRHQPPGAGGRRGRWPAHATRVHLERLDFDGLVPPSCRPCSAFARVSDALARRLYDRAGGNPFFLEQMCAALLEQQAVTRA